MISLTGFAKYQDQKLIDPHKHDGRTFLLHTANRRISFYHLKNSKRETCFQEYESPCLQLSQCQLFQRSQIKTAKRDDNNH